MKKVIYSVLVFALVLTIAGCGSKKKDKKEEKPKKATIDYMVLVNKKNKLPNNWEELVELETAKDAWGDDVQVEKKALEQFYKLQKDLLAEGIDIELDSIYRSVAEQQDLWDRWTVEKGEEYVKTYVAVPGYSEHHTGLAIDVCLKIDGEIVADNEEMIANKEIFAKVHAKLADYGFILRYPEGKKDITGYDYEPWHFRYINDTKIAKEIMDNNLTFEEYLEKNK
ncbi:MAG: M15 family metallopeptidase [Bacilli bacterium]|nr:M15 family metallopeptidase [Bacilli bacterium]